MTLRDRIGEIAAAWVVAATAGCTQAPWEALESADATVRTAPRRARALQPVMDASPSPADVAAVVPEDASRGDSGVDAASEATTRHFPHIDYDAFPPAPKPPVCPSGGMVNVAPSQVFFRLGPADTILGSVSPDGLTAAWTIPGSNSPGASTPTTVFVADRASTGEAFGAPEPIDFGQLLVAPDKVALSPDGLRLVVVRADQLAFAELARTTRTDPFGSPSEDAFALVNAAAQTTNGPLGDPTIAGDDRAFLYTRALSVIESDRTSTEPWPEGEAVSLEYSLNPGQRPRLSAISEDRLTLFFWDDQRLVENASWRILLDGPFRDVVWLPVVPRAQPTASCDGLFFASADSSGDIYLALATSTRGP